MTSPSDERARFLSAFGSHPRPVLLLDGRGLVAANDAACVHLGFSEQAVLDVGLATLARDPSTWERRLAPLLAGDEVSTTWVDLVRAGDGTHGAQVRATALPTVGGEHGPFVVVVELELSIDVPVRSTEARRARQRYERLVDAAQEGIWEVDTEGVTVFANQRMAEILGCEVRDLIGRPMTDFFDPELMPVVEAQFAAIRDGRTGRFDARCRRVDGASVWLMASAIPLFDEDGLWTGAAATAVDVTERRRHEAALRETEELLRRTFDGAPIGMALIGLDGTWERVNDAACRMLGRPRDELMSLTFQDITHPDDLDRDLGLLHQTLAGERTGYAIDKRYLRPDGEVVWATLTVGLVRGDSDEPLFFVSQLEDVTARKQAEEGMEQARRRTQQVLDRAAVAMAIVDADGTMTDCNLQFLTLFGGQATDGESAAVPVRARGALEALGPLVAAADTGIATLDLELDEHRIVQMLATSVEERADSAWIVQAIDVTRDRRLALLAERDPLTGVANRRGLRRAASELPRGAEVAVLFVDLDGFKEVNDTLGHDAGDRLLMRVADALRGEVREEDLVVRLGGDEFAVLLCDCDAATAATIAARVLAVVNTDDVSGGVVTASIGTACGLGREVDELTDRADRAMLDAKRLGKNRVVAA